MNRSQSKTNKTKARGWIMSKRKRRSQLLKLGAKIKEPKKEEIEDQTNEETEKGMNEEIAEATKEKISKRIRGETRDSPGVTAGLKGEGTEEIDKDTEIMEMVENSESIITREGRGMMETEVTEATTTGIETGTIIGRKGGMTRIGTTTTAIETTGKIEITANSRTETTRETTNTATDRIRMEESSHGRKRWKR